MEMQLRLKYCVPLITFTLVHCSNIIFTIVIAEIGQYSPTLIVTPWQIYCTASFETATGWCHIVAKHFAVHYNDVIMGAMASLITGLTTVYSTVYSDADQRKHQSSAPLAFVGGFTRDRWIPRTNGQQRGKCLHLMTSSCLIDIFIRIAFKYPTRCPRHREPVMARNWTTWSRQCLLILHN